ncbi:restriction endonuclease subunit S [Holdemanella biformis]|uniref:restriction endonuclease subunit S n=1 Tax=Holdemanella biformis TaxID=1735 RepID=UPI001D146FE2|nr:restriction endonuclease subunit S [Holdemanella biformis]MCC3354485.1 restriction endonuclease subunit S [Holdemanella biformis]
MVPNLRFREFNEQLVYTSFGHVMKLYRGSSPRPIINYVTTDKSGLNWIKIGDMPSTGNRVFFCKERINKEGSKKSRAVYKGDIILSNSMSFGKPYILEIDGFIHDGWFVIRDYQNYIDKTYLCQLLSSDVVQKQYKSTAAGGVVKNISSDLVNSVKFHLPSIMEQRKIARFLELIDQKIEVQIKIINDYKLLKKYITKSFIKQKGTSYLLSEIAELGRGRVISSVEISKQKNPIYPVYSSQTSNNGVMGYLDNYDYEGEYITWTTDGANAGTVYYRNGKFNCTNVCGILKIKNGYDAYYISNILNCYTKKYVSTNLANPKLMNNVMANIKINLPSIERQKYFSNILKAIEYRVKIEQDIKLNLVKQKVFLLKNMFL